MNKRITNKYDISFLAYANTPSGREIVFDFYPTDEELENILIATLKAVFKLTDENAKTLLALFGYKESAEKLDCYIDGRILEEVIGGQDLYELWANEKHY